MKVVDELTSTIAETPEPALVPTLLAAIRILTEALERSNRQVSVLMAEKASPTDPLTDGEAEPLVVMVQSVHAPIRILTDAVEFSYQRANFLAKEVTRLQTEEIARLEAEIKASKDRLEGRD